MRIIRIEAVHAAYVDRRWTGPSVGYTTPGDLGIMLPDVMGSGGHLNETDHGEGDIKLISGDCKGNWLLIEDSAYSIVSPLELLAMCADDNGLSAAIEETTDGGAL